MYVFGSRSMRGGDRARSTVVVLVWRGVGFVDLGRYGSCVCT